MLIALAIGFAILAWWGSTAAIVWLDALPRRTHRYSLAGMSALTLAALAALRVTTDDTGIAAAFVAFAGGLVAWGWQEMSFYTGAVTGPRAAACVPGATGWPRFVQAVGAVLWHELASVATGALIVALTWRQPNMVGAWTFAALWGMRLSAKLNVFLGVRNLHEALLPDHLGYLASYFARRPMNPLFPVSLAAAAAATAIVAGRALADEATAFQQVGYALVATMMALAVIEHLMLVLPIPPGVERLLGLAPRVPGNLRVAAATA